jgi:hypothetical protein
MTLDDIEGIFNKAAFDGRCQFGGLNHRAGSRAVVAALRDEWFPQSEPPRTITVEERWFLNRLNEILASDGVDKPHICDGDVGPSLHQLEGGSE